MKLLIAPIVSVLTSVLINAGIDVDSTQLEVVLNAIVTLLAGAIAHYIAKRKYKQA